MATGFINKLESFGSVDGPGIRFVVFLQGCPMRCKFCHNPETWGFGKVNGAIEMTARELLEKALRYRTYWGKDGGITVSGGEPLAQLDFMVEFFELAKASGVHTCIDTSGVTFRRSGEAFAKIERLMQVTDLLLASFLAGGHVLLEDMPGTGKTVLARSMARSMDVRFGRIQFTPDLLPGDVTGIHYFDQGQGKFVFREGPVFANLLLADEINRATPRTQSALDGETRKLADPFMVIATQNPVETYGCFPLPEAQLDRFLMKLSMGSMTQDQECAMLDRFITDEPLQSLQPVVTHEEVCALRGACREVFVHEDLRTYMVRLVQSTRQNSDASGVSPRGTLALLRASQGYAMVQGRDFVTPEDVKAVAIPVLAHRCIGGQGGERENTLQIAELIGTDAVGSGGGALAGAGAGAGSGEGGASHPGAIPVPTENWSRS